MNYVYVVLVAYDYEGENVRGVFDNEKDAEALRQKFIKSRTGDNVLCEKWEINKEDGAV